MKFQKGHIPWNTGKERSKETKEKLRFANLGKKVSEEVKRKISQKMKGGNSTSFKKGLVPWNKGKKCPEISERLFGKRRLEITGKKNVNWKGGITPINHKIRASLEYRLWREAVFKRDNHTCIWCGVKSQKGIKVIIHADHIKPFAHYPALRFAIDNGRTLCISCHKKTDTYAGKGLKRIRGQ